MQIEATFSILTGFERFLKEIIPYQENRSNIFTFDSFLNGFERSPTGPRKSKQAFQFWVVFE